MQKERESNFELLRILAIIGIIGSHFLGHGGILFATNLNQPNFYFANIFESFFNVSVNCFILISGYFSIKVKFKRLLELELQILFYSFSIAIIFWALHIVKFSIKELILSMIPMLSMRWWFITIYVALVLLSPFLNIFIDNITRHQHLKLLILLFLLFPVYSTIFSSSLDNSLGFGIINFMFLYLIGSYIKRYNVKWSNKKSLLFFIISTLFIFLGTIILSIKSGKFNNHFYSYNNIFILTQGISLFLLFKNFKFYSIIINKISPFVFGVYLLDDHTYIRNYIYKNIFYTAKFYYNNLFIIHLVVSILIIFIICLFIEYLRSLLFKVTIYKIINSKVINYCSNKFITYIRQL
jgi:surface polysaccharide O-acyltransferase-like enzyme